MPEFGVLEFRVLGPLQVTIAGRPVPVGTAPKRQLVLAVLLARAGRPVPTDTLVAAVWGGHPPASARRNLQLYVHHLRRVLGAGRIAAAADGYLLDPGEGLDATRFRRLAAGGDQALGAGDPVTAEASLRAGLDLWGGLAFAEFLDCELVADEARQLELLRLECHERWAEAQLVTGATPRLVTELTELCRLHPYRETLPGQLMRALYQSGRPAEALAVFRQTRALLVEQLGVEPSPPLRRLHEAVLRRDEALLAAPAQQLRPVTAATPATVPRELPPDPPDFTGRRELLDRLDESLPDGARPARPTVLCGMAGVGKTTVAVHWGHRVAGRFPDGQVYLDLRGYAAGPPVPPLAAIGQLLGALGVSRAQVPVELDAATGLYRTLLVDRRMLLVLDNARDAEQVRPLLPAAPGCLALVTSRDRLTGLVARDGARRLALDVLAPTDAAELVARLLGGPGPPAAALARACGHLPLAIRIASAHLVDRPGTVAGYLAAVGGDTRLDALEAGGDPAASVRSAFTYSYRALAPAAQRLFRLLGLFPGPDVPVPAAAALAGTNPERSRQLLDQLARAHLVDPGQPGRYALHDLLRVYAAEQAQAADPAECTAATARLHDFYLSAVDAAAGLLYPRVARLPIEVPDGFPDRTELPDEAAATGWLDAELVNLVAITEHAARHGPYRVAWLLANSLGGYFWLRARYGPQWLATAGAGLAAATAGGDPAALAAANLTLAVAHRVLGRPAEAVRYATEALTASRQVGWRRGEVGALGNLGSAHAELGDNRAALAATDAALAVNREIAGPAGAAGPLANRCALRVRMGQLPAALRDGLAALAAYQEIHDPPGQANAHFNTALCHLYLGELDPARQHLDRAQQLFESVGERYGLTLTRCAVAKLHLDAGRHRSALECATATLQDALAADFHGCAALSLVDLVEARRCLGDHRQAVRDCGRAVQLARQGGHHTAEVLALIALAEAYLPDRLPERALASVAAARRLADRFGYRLLVGLALTVQAEIALATGDCIAAARYAQSALAIHRASGYRLAAERCRRLLGQIGARPAGSPAGSGSVRQALPG